MITIYTKDDCGFCLMAKGWLKNHDFEYDEVNISEYADAGDFIRNAGHRTVPQIYWNGPTGVKLLVEGGATGLKDVGADGLKKLIEHRLTEERAMNNLGSI